MLPSVIFIYSVKTMRLPEKGTDAEITFIDDEADDENADPEIISD